MKHTPDCSRVFKQYDKTCGRCLELMSGATPREGWGNMSPLGKELFKLGSSFNHVCKDSCKPVCTFGDW